MNLNHPLRSRRFMSPDDASGGGGTSEDRGDGFTPPEDTSGQGTEGEAAAAALLAKELADKAAAETADSDDAEVAVTADGEGKKDVRKESRIPLSRHEKILQKERDARQGVERELAKYKEGSQVANLNKDITAAETELVGWEEEYAKLVVDGDAKKAAEVMAKIRKTERDIGDAKSDMKLQASNARMVENARYTIAMDRVEAEYPQLDPSNEDFDEEVYADVVELLTGYKAQGYTPTDALQKAVRKELGARTAAQKAVLDTTPRVDAKAIAAERKVAATEKAVKAVEGTPPSTQKVGLDSDKIGGGLSAKAVMNMNHSDFSKLSDSALAKLRGDEL